MSDNGSSMRHFLDGSVYGLLGAVHLKRYKMETQRNKEAILEDTLERVVDSIDPRIRLVGGYKKKLLSVVSSSIDYADELVDQIPAPIEVSSKTFVSDPYVNTFFASIEDMQAAFSCSSELRDFMKECDNAQVDQCCALLCMHKTEKTVMGMELSGDILRKEVQQISVSFSDHRIYSPTSSEAETRRGLKDCLFGGLATNVIERITQLKLVNHKLQGKRHMLQARLREYGQKMAEAENRLPSGNEVMQEIEKTTRELKEAEDQLMKTQPATPQESLEQVSIVFSQPDKFVRLQKTPLILNKMGIKISKDSHQSCNVVNLTEVTVGDELPRAITLARFPRDELLPRMNFLHQAFSSPLYTD